MRSWLAGRPGHYALLITVAAALFLPRLGTPSLWDIDEGHNAEAAREMLESGNWIVPTFNFKLRVDKPALLYWLQMTAYQLFGVNEFAARLPSALASVLAVLLTYELGRTLFGAAAGLLSGLVLASTVLFCGAAHFANPDALLNVFTLLTLLFFWLAFARASSSWLVPAGVAAGLAVLAKGPVGFVLPGAVAFLFLLLTRRLALLWNRHLVLGLLAYGVVAFPWYIWVAVDTKADFLRGFFLTHNVNRFLSPMENHRGPFYYYGLVLVVGFAPWSAFLGLTAWASYREWRGGRVARPESAKGVEGVVGQDSDPVQAGQDRNPVPHNPTPFADSGRANQTLASAHLFLWCWTAVFLVFFTVSSTKLPNYILPMYPPLALLTARFLERWRRGEIAPPAWTLNIGLACLALVGAAAAFGLFTAGGTIEVSALRGRQLVGLGLWGVLGAVPVMGAALAWWAWHRQRRTLGLGTVAGAAVFFVGGLAAGGAIALDAHKAPRPLGQLVRAVPDEPDVRVGCFGYYQPSLVFYCRREVARFETPDQALEFLRWPLPVYLFLPERVWETLRAPAPATARVVGRHYDFYRGYQVVLVTNRPAQSP